MSAESSDCEQISEWTLVNASGDDEDPSVDLSARGSSLEEVSKKHSDEASDGVPLGPFQLESKLCEILEVLNNKEDHAMPKNPSKEGSEASDIERISDDGMDGINYSMEGSVISQLSTFSLLNAPESRDADTESLSGSSEISVIQEDDVRPTNYMHTPNRKLNFTLNLLLVLSVTMVVGLGLGHFIGWSSRWMHARQIHQANIAKLKALQEELVDCLQNPSSYYLETNGESKACYEKVDYWKTKFEDMLSENRVLQEFVDRTMHKANLDDDEDDDKCEEANKNIVAEYRQLKFHLIMQQLENVATLRQVEALKHQEMETLYRVKQLEEENEELKAQVEDESNGDVAREAEEKAIETLSAENQELKQELNKLMTALKLEQEEDEKKTTDELWPLRQQINQLQVENSELKQVIAKLRYGQPPAEQRAKKQAKIAPPKSRFANREPPQKPDNALHSWLVDNMKELNLTDFIEYLTKIAMDKEAARQELMHLEENLKLSYEQLSEKAKHGIDTGKTLLSDLQKSLHSKLQQIMNMDPSDIALPIEHIQKAGKTLKKTVEKMYAIGMDMLNTKEEDGPENDGNHKFKKQVDKLMVKFGKQWENIKSSVWGAKTEEASIDFQHAEKKEKQEEPNDDIFVAASREDLEKNEGFLHEERTEKSKREKKDEKNKQKKTTINNGEEKQIHKEKLHPSEEPNKLEKKQSKKDKKNKEREAEKHRKNVKEETSDKEDLTAEKSKGDINDKKKNKFSRKHYNEDIQYKTNSNTKKSDKRGNSENSFGNRDSSVNKKKGKDDSSEHKLKEKHIKKQNHEEHRLNSKLRKNKHCKEKKKDEAKEFKRKDKCHKNHKNDDDESTSNSKINKNKSLKQNTNHTKFNDEHSGDWMFQRAEDRTTKRKSKHQSDWLFERAYDRENIRREAQKSEWYFSKNRKNEELSYGKSKKSSNDKEAAKSNKKTNKMRKNQRQGENEDSSDEEEEFIWSEQSSRRHAYHYEYNVDWAMPDSRAYYSSCS